MHGEEKQNRFLQQSSWEKNMRGAFDSMKDKIKLTIFEERFGWGGIETFIINLCNYIDLKKFDVTIVVANKVTDCYDDFFKERNIPIYILVPEIEANPIKRFKKGLPAFSKYLEANKVDIIHFNLSNSIDMQYVAMAKKHGINNRIVHSHNSAATTRIKTIAHRMGKNLWGNSATYYLACSQKAAKWLFPSGVYNKNHYKIIHNAIEADRYKFDANVRNSIRHEFNWNNKLIVGEVGRFNLQKNHKFLIDIFYEIIKLKPESKLILVGDGELRSELENYVQSKGLNEYVEFMGTSNRVPEILQGLDVFALPSLYEGLPFVMVEAQAASLPIVASDTITKEVFLTEYVKYESLQNNPKEWADKILEASEMPRVVSTVEKIKSAGFDVKSMAEDLMNLYREMMVERNDE